MTMGRHFFQVASAALLATSFLTTGHAGSWNGYMNVFTKQPDSTQGGFVFGSLWGVVDLKTTLIAAPGAGTAITNNVLELFPNYNTYNAADPFWADGAVGNKWMEANTFVEQANLTQESVTFTGTVDAYTLSPDYTAEAFIKVLDPTNGYSTSLFERQNLSGQTAFSLTADTFFFTGQLLQIGFVVSGVNANPADAATLGSVRVTTEPSIEPTPIDWRGYMNVSNLTPSGGKGGYAFGGPWGVSDLQTTVVTPSSPTLDDNQLILAPNFNAYTDAVNNQGVVAGPEARAFWTNSTDGGVTAGPLGNKWMEGLTFVEDTIVAGTDGSFAGRVDAYTLSADYTAEAFVKVLNPATGYSESLYLTENLSGDNQFSLTPDLSGFVGQLLQRGFVINGINANVANAESIGSVTVTTFPGIDPGVIVINVASGSQTQAQAGYATIATATSVTKTGAGTVVFDAANAYTGPTTVSAGTLEVRNAGAVAASNVTVDTGATLAIAAGTTMRSPSVIVDGGTLAASALAINSTTGITALAINAGGLANTPAVTIAGGGTMSLVQDARVTVAVGSLAVAEGSGGGRLDVGAGQVAVAAGGITAADLRADLLAGRSGGAWNGATGITSSAAAASGGTRTVGYLIGGDGSATVSFAAAGDTNLNGQVDVFDLVAVNSSGKYGTGTASIWNQGDFNYDGVTSVFDLVSINTSGAYGQGNYFPASPTAAGGISAVPEPGSLGLLAAGVVGLAVARRRRG
jgi:autotransporter-associated beta strand protein